MNVTNDAVNISHQIDTRMDRQIPYFVKIKYYVYFKFNVLWLSLSAHRILPQCASQGDIFALWEDGAFQEADFQ